MRIPHVAVSGTGRPLHAAGEWAHAESGRSEAGKCGQLVLEPDTEACTVIIPAELEAMLRAHRALRKWHDALGTSYRKAIADSVAEPKSAAARQRRADLWAEPMLLAMEGEEETPPILEAAFWREPKARVGWLAMTAAQRRGHLLGTFY